MASGHKLTAPQNNLGWTSRDCLVQFPCTKQENWRRLLRPCSVIWNIYKDRESTASLGNLFQCLVTLFSLYTVQIYWFTTFARHLNELAAYLSHCTTSCTVATVQGYANRCGKKLTKCNIMTVNTYLVLLLALLLSLANSCKAVKAKTLSSFQIQWFFYPARMKDFKWCCVFCKHTKSTPTQIVHYFSIWSHWDLQAATSLSKNDNNKYIYILKQSMIITGIFHIFPLWDLVCSSEQCMSYVTWKRTNTKVL